MNFKNWKLTRRQLIEAGLISGAGMMLPQALKVRKAWAQIGGGTLKPGDVSSTRSR